jgi:hypothetical protein
MVYVDDVLAAYSPRFDMETLLLKFEWGSKKWLHDGELTFCGRELCGFFNDGRKAVKIHQKTYIAGLRYRRVKKTGLPLSKSEVSEYLSVIGSLMWLGGHSRPEVSAPTSLVQRSAPSTDDLHDVYEILKGVIDYADAGYVIQDVGARSAADFLVVGYGDASFGNSLARSSQTGLLVVVTHRDASVAVEGRPGSVIMWRSKRTARVVHSTLAAEAVASDGAADFVSYTCAFLGEALGGTKAILADLQPPAVGGLIVTDCRSLFDAFHSPQPNLSEKRTEMVVRSLKLSSIPLKWVPNEYQLADGLTKAKAALTLRDLCVSVILKG